jgi:hypothetical protein
VIENRDMYQRELQFLRGLHRIETEVILSAMVLEDGTPQLMRLNGGSGNPQLGVHRAADPTSEPVPEEPGAMRAGTRPDELE